MMFPRLFLAFYPIARVVANARFTTFFSFTQLLGSSSFFVYCRANSRFETTPTQGCQRFYLADHKDIEKAQLSYLNTEVVVKQGFNVLWWWWWWLWSEVLTYC